MKDSVERDLAVADELGRMADARIKELEHERTDLRRVLRMCLQQFEFTYGKRKRGWDAQYLMEECGALLGDAAYQRDDNESLSGNIGALIDAWEGLPNDLKFDLTTDHRPFVVAMQNLIGNVEQKP